MTSTLGSPTARGTVSFELLSTLALTPLTPLSTDESVALLENDVLKGARQKDLLLASSPLENEPLVTLLAIDNPMSSGHMRELLIANSPLSPDVLADVTANRMGNLDPEDVDAILTANQ